MKVFSSVNDPAVAAILKTGGIGVLRTDTLYGVVARSDDEAAVHRVYELKGRDDDKSPIVLINSPEQIYDKLEPAHRTYLDQVWPGPVSVIVPSALAPSWISRANASVAYRLPSNQALRTLIRITGPLIAPSANPQGMPPAVNVDEAQAYFGDGVDFYVDEGTVDNPTPSQIIQLTPDGETIRLR